MTQYHENIQIAIIRYASATSKKLTILNALFSDMTIQTNYSLPQIYQTDCYDKKVDIDGKVDIDRKVDIDDQSNFKEIISHIKPFNDFKD